MSGNITTNKQNNRLSFQQVIPAAVILSAGLYVLSSYNWTEAAVNRGATFFFTLGEDEDER